MTTESQDLKNALKITDFKPGDQVIFKTEVELMNEFLFVDGKLQQNSRGFSIEDITIPFSFNSTMTVFCGHTGVIKSISPRFWQGHKTQILKVIFDDPILDNKSFDWTFSGQMLKKLDIYEKETLKNIFEQECLFQDIESALDLI